PNWPNPLNYLISIGTFPNNEVNNLNDQKFTGQFISIFIFTHIDLDNTIHAKKRFESGSMYHSISFEFHPYTFKQLFHIIEQLTLLPKENLNENFIYILMICVRLFTNHLKFLSAMTIDLDQNLLKTNVNIKNHLEFDHSSQTKRINLSDFATNDELKKWLHLLLTLVCIENKRPEENIICKEASKAITYILDKYFSSFIQKLAFIHKYIIENEHDLLIEELLIELNSTLTLLCWIEVLCENDDSKIVTPLAFTILYSFVNFYLNSPRDNKTQKMHQILQRFQQLLFSRLIPEYRIKSMENTDDSTDKFTLSTVSLIIKYITHLLVNSNGKLVIVNELLNSILVGLCLIVEPEFQLNFTIIQQILSTLLPLLVDFIMQNMMDEESKQTYLHYNYWLLSRMSHVLINGPLQDPLELKYSEKLQSPLFAGGCEQNLIGNNQHMLNLFESNIATYSQFKFVDYQQQSKSDQEFLMSIYNNRNACTQLITKMKISLKDKQSPVQKSIEPQANEACAALFAVYLKHYRRINLAQYELLTLMDNHKPHSKLLAIFEYANRMQTLFARTRGQGNDCNELYDRIQIKTYFLLTSVKESRLISTIDIENDLTAVDNSDKREGLKFKRLYSKWKTERKSFRVLCNTLRVCIRLKQLMLAKRKVIEQKQDNENILHQAIVAYVYGDISNDDKKSESNDLIRCMSRQYERAIMRLIAYRFIQKFVQKTLEIENNHSIRNLLTIYLSQLRKTHIEWTYLESIPAINHYLKEEIKISYYSIVETILSYVLESLTIEQTMLIQTMFYLLNLPYTSEDTYYIFDCGLVAKLFKSFVSLVNRTNRTISFEIKLIGYNWFRLYVTKLCKTLDIEDLKIVTNFHGDQKREFIFHELILNELTTLKQQLSSNIEDTILDDTESKQMSFHNSALEWFVGVKAKSNLSSNFEIELCIKQWLMFLLRCVHSYEHVRYCCATKDYVDELLLIYRNSKNPATSLLALKILRKLIPFLREKSNETCQTMMKDFLNHILFSIGHSFISRSIIPDLVTELIYIYRTIISLKSPWQSMATQLIFDTCTSSWKSLESIDMNNTLGLLCIFGGYIHPYCLGAIVQVYIVDEMNRETQLAVIIDIDQKARDFGTTDAKPYFIQYIETNKTEWVTADKLRIDVDILPPNLLDLPNANELIDLVFDSVAYFLKIQTSIIEPLLLLELKRRSISALYRILINKELVEIFMKKSYANILVKLSTLNLSAKAHSQPMDLRLSNKQHLEQYCLSLDRCKYLKQIVDDTSIGVNTDVLFTIWNDIRFTTWKSVATKSEIEQLKRVRIGNDEIKIVPMPLQNDSQWFLEECGTRDRFPGRIYLISKNSNTIMTTFIVDNLKLSEGNWYYCVRLLESNFTQIGWATTGFNPNNTLGIGNDQYSWSYGGAQGKIYHNSQYSFEVENVRWTANDVCGCGIEINGDRIRINYWLNGSFLGTAFSHRLPIGSTTTLCDMLPNGCDTNYFPGVSLKVTDESILSSCEFIFNPEDMLECPLPEGYKPLIVPKLDNIVFYPYSAYLIADHARDNIYTTRRDRTTTFLRDFINGHHLETTFTVDDRQLILPKYSSGFPLIVDRHESWTLSFDFRILTQHKIPDLILAAFDVLAIFSIRMPTSKVNDQTRVAIVFDSNASQIKLYINNECRSIECPALSNFNIHILPAVSAELENLAIWKYALSKEHIRRLFTSGLSYVVRDYHRLDYYRKQAKTLTFTDRQQYFLDESLVPLNEPFDENKWAKRMHEIDDDEWKYFKIIDGTNQSAIELFGNKTYLVLNKSINTWFEYTLILDITIANLPTINEQLTLITLNSQSTIYLTYDGHLCLYISSDTHVKSESVLDLKDYVRLVISVQQKSLKIYANGILQLDVNVDDDQLILNDKHIDLFREHDLTKNTTASDALRIVCKSITVLNKATNDIDERMKSSNYSLEILVAPPYSIIAPSLVDIGYDTFMIRDIVQANRTLNIQSIDAILRDMQNELFTIDDEKRLKYQKNILSKLSPSIDKEILKNFLQFSEFDADENISNLTEVMLLHWNEIQSRSTDTTEESANMNWFYQAVHRLNIDDNLTEWIHDKSMTEIEEVDSNHSLIDLARPVEQQTIMIHDTQDDCKRISRSIQYSHQQISHQQYFDSRLACEHELISIYAHYTILNVLKIWSNDGSSIFPWEKFSDCAFIVTLLRLFDYHYNYTRLYTDETIDRMTLLVLTILRVETNELLKYHTMTYDDIVKNMLKQKAPQLYHLQKDTIVQLIQFLSNRQLLYYDYENKSTMIKQPNFKFILKLMNMFLQLLTEKSPMKQHEIDFLLPILFPDVLIDLLFDIFLLIPRHRSKIAILHLFSTLIKTSKNFNLSRRILQFLFHLFVDLQPNPTLVHSRLMKAFQITLMDLIFLLCQRQKNRSLTTNQTVDSFEFDFSQFSQNFHRILTAIDVINALTDRTKQTSFPDAFLQESPALLGDDYQLTKDEIEQSNSHFDIIADRQLVHFMNNHSLINSSFIDFINNLPTGSLPDPTYYKVYPSLWHISVNLIRIRAKLFYQFSLYFEKVLSVIDLNLSPGQSILFDKLQIGRVYMLYRMKFQFFNNALVITQLASDDSLPIVNFDPVRASSNTYHGRNTMFYQAYEQLYSNAHLTFRKLHDRLWRAQYLGMRSCDQGGPYRDSISCICSDICSTRLPLFVLCPNGRTNSGLNQDRWIPNVYPPNKPISNRIKKQYQFIGQLMGMAIRKKHYLDLKFPSLLWKHLVKDQVTIEDIEAIDAQSFTLINEIEKCIEQSSQSIAADCDINDLLSSILDEIRFEVVSSAGQAFELIPGGKDIPITGNNFKEYCKRYRDYRLHEFDRQIEFIRQGLYSVVPGYFLSLFTIVELEEAVCGKARIDIELLKQHTTYGGCYTSDSLCIQRFWTVLAEMFNEEQQKLFLKFVWGRCTLPRCHDEFKSEFRIDPYDVSNASIDSTLPQSHTCSFVLDLPAYSSVDVMYNRLNYAITYCSSIDGDSSMNEAPAPNDVDSDWSDDDRQ
ncbi:unnamed protein product, partial [Rotaria magnacalcarata]